MEFFVTCSGLPVHVSDSGKGDKFIVMLHGYLETLYIWEEFGHLLPDSFRIISMDLPGFGLTGTDPQINGTDRVAEVLIALLDNLRITGKVILVGHSMGGYIAQRLLAKAPERVECLINLNSNPYSDTPEKIVTRQREINLIQAGKLVQLAQISVPASYAKANLRKCDEKIKETIEICETHDPSGVVASVMGLIQRPDSLQLIKDSSVPVMFIYGDSDSIMPADSIQSLMSELPGATHIVLPATGHNSFIEAPERTAEAILAFVNVPHH